MEDKKEEVVETAIVLVGKKEITALNAWEVKLKKVVAENPFIEVKDKATADIARKRVATLREHRLELRTTGKKESQESMLMNSIKQMQVFVKSKIDNFVGIVGAPEDKQSDELKKWDDAETERKRKAKEAEEKRVENAKARIKRFEKVSLEIIKKMTFETMDETLEKLARFRLSSRDYDFKEFELLVEDASEKISNWYNTKIEEVKASEETRIANIETEQEAKVNEMFVQAVEAMDILNSENEADVQTKLDEILNTEFDFGKFKEKANDTYSAIKRMFQEKKTAIENESILQEARDTKDQKKKVETLGRGLLDKVFQMTVEDFEEETDFIMKALNQDTEPVKFALSEFKLLKIEVEAKLKEKLEVLAEEIKTINANNEVLKKEREAKEAKLFKRIEKLGFVLTQEEQSFTYKDSGISINKSFIKETEWEKFDDIIGAYKAMIQEFEQTEKEAQERIDRLSCDKDRMSNKLSIAKGLLTETNCVYQNEESKEFFLKLQKEFTEFIEEKLTEIDEY